jgi:hypothetical protein
MDDPVYRSADGGLEGPRSTIFDRVARWTLVSYVEIVLSCGNDETRSKRSLDRVRRKTVQGHVMTGSATKTDQAIADNPH